MKKNEIKNTTKKETNIAYAPIYKDYYYYTGQFTEQDIKNPDVSVLAEYNTPYSLIYEDNYRNRNSTTDTTGIDGLTNMITIDRFIQMVSCCTSGLIYSIIETSKYEFRQSENVMVFVNLFCNDCVSGMLHDSLIRSMKIGTFDTIICMINSINDQHNIQETAKPIGVFVNTIVAEVFNTLHVIVSREIYGTDPLIFSRIMDIITRCIIVYHDNLNLSIYSFILDLSKNEEFLLANNINDKIE